MTRNSEEPINIDEGKTKKRNKVLLEVKSSPKNVKFDTLMRLLELCGFDIKTPRRGSHYVCEKDDVTLIVPKPHGGKKCVNVHYVKQAIEIIEEMIEKEG